MSVVGISWLHTPEILILWIVLIIVIVCLYFFRPKKENFIDIELISEVYGNSSFLYRIFVCVLIIFSLLLFVLLAWPYSSESQEKIKKDGIDIEIVFDLSYSMIAEDITPSRIEVAKNVLSDFVWELEADRIGLILFSGKPFQSVPLSYDYDFLQEFIEAMDVETINQAQSWLQWTAIWDGLVLASDILSSQDSEREKIIILITDGEANKWVEPALALKLLKQKGIKTYTIGVGKEGDTAITITTPLGIAQRILIGGLDETILQKIASETGWKYFRADSSQAFQDILDTIAKLEKSTLETEIYSFEKSKIGFILILWLMSVLWLWFFVFIKKIRL